jgi:chromosome segregation ATPase
MELRSLTARATNAERRLTIAQNQLAAAEERLATMNQKTTAADTKWEARVKEYEDRLKAAEEKYKRERQGSKESQTAYETQIKCVLAGVCEIPGTKRGLSDRSTVKRSLRRSATRSCKTS